jgi:hypothetical protein
MNIKTEYNAGYKNGLKHDITSALHRGNLFKCISGQKSDFPLVRAYWHGYWVALDEWAILKRVKNEKFI